MASPANPRDFFLQSVQTALTNAGQLNVLKVFNPAKNYDYPWAFADLGLEEDRDKGDESNHKVAEYEQDVFILLGFTINTQDTGLEGLLAAEGNKWIYHIQNALRKMLKTMGTYQDTSCFIAVKRIQLKSAVDGYDNQELTGQSLIFAKIIYTLTLL